MTRFVMAERKSTKTIRKKIIYTWASILFVFMAELFFYTWCGVQSVKFGYDISKIAARQKELLKLQKNLTIELARLKSPQRITETAQSRFGLIVPAPEQVITVP
ncbi:MAG: hypothetical protein AB1659_02710 [Thermodesulfobacteriota bacterium]